MAGLREALFGSMAVRAGLISAEQLKEGLDFQAAERAAGPLGQVDGLAAAGAALQAEALALQDRDHVVGAQRPGLDHDLAEAPVGVLLVLLGL